jgi:hypothetical protein
MNDPEQIVNKIPIPHEKGDDPSQQDGLGAQSEAGAGIVGRHMQQPAISVEQTGGQSQDVQELENSANIVQQPGKEQFEEEVRRRIGKVVEDEKTFPSGEEVGLGERIEKRKESFKRIDPTLSENEITTGATMVELLRGRQTLNTDEKQQVVKLLTGIPQEQARDMIDASELSDEAKSELLSALKPAEKENKEVSDEEKTHIRASGNAMTEELQQNEEIMEGRLEEAKKHPEQKEHTERLENVLRSIRNLKRKMSDFFHPDEPVKTWALRGGKTIYIALLTAFILTIATMSMLNKAVAKK